MSRPLADLTISIKFSNASLIYSGAISGLRIIGLVALALGRKVFTPCECERHAGKSASRNGKHRFVTVESLNFIESYQSPDGKKVKVSKGVSGQLGIPDT